MSSIFQNPRNPLAAMWASATESYLRNQHPGMAIGDIRRLPMMQGVYEHLYQLKRKSRVEKPTGGTAASEALEIAQNAYLSQAFFDQALTMAAFATADNTGNTAYETYISLLDSYNDSHDIADFSTADVGGFALCLIVWIGYTGLRTLSTVQRNYLNYLLGLLPLTTEQRQRIEDEWLSIFTGDYNVQYRDAHNYPNYGAIPWKIPAGAQIVMLGDWGTSLDDAHQFLFAIWKQAFFINPAAPIVFIHLGDIYYTGLSYECQNYFYDVFVNVGKQLQNNLNDHRFNPNPPIFTLPGNHEYYSYGYGYFELLDNLNKNVPNIAPSQLSQQCSFFCLQTADSKWQFLGMDTGQADGNALLSALQSLGDVAMSWATENLPDWDWLNWITGLAQSAYEDFTGPFQPTLRPNEVTWLKNQLNTFPGKTIMLSHHQLFSREAKINHDVPEFMNTWLDKTFSSYYKSNIAAWYWGHEHSFATYLDGLMGLNKGRLLGSSSYEATDADDTPYANNYPMVPLGFSGATPIQKSSSGLYYHAGAILSQSGSNMSVKYYQFPAWSQLDHPPSGPALQEITSVDETITTTFKSLKPTWIDGKPINSNTTTTDHSPGITTWDGWLYMLYADGVSDSSKYTISTYNANNFKPVSTGSVPTWTAPVHITVGGSTINTSYGRAAIAVDGKLYAFYIDSNSYLQGICCAAPATNPSVWTSIGKMPSKVHATSPAICLFQGRIYIVYIQSGSDNNMGWGYYDIAAATWYDFGALNDIHGKQLQTGGTPVMTANPYQVFLTFQEKGSNNICWAVGTPDTDLPTATQNNISWINNGHINTNAQDGVSTPQVGSGMTLCYTDGVICLVYVSTSNQYLTQCVLQGMEVKLPGNQMSTGTWIGKDIVRTGANTSSPSNQKSSKAPGLAVAAGGGFLVYRAASSDAIFCAYY